MPAALDLRGIIKRYVAGVRGCMASADVLRRVDVEMHQGECVAIVGGAGAGKSTLLLCAAGLMVPDAGDIRWFGDADRAAAVRRATYYFVPGRYERRQPARREAARRRETREPHVHLIDGIDGLAHDTIARLAEWTERRRKRGDAIVIAARDPDVGAQLASRCLTIRSGQLHVASRSGTTARVAERVRIC
jgi:predicted ABC-type transport system involved in lysophospholipase L1 biosynthesis ATPase subunit